MHPCCTTLYHSAHRTRFVTRSIVFVFFCIVLIRFVVVMGQVGPVKRSRRSPGRVHDLRDAHSCMKKKCLEVPEALPTCGTTHSMAVPPYTSDHVRYLYAYLIIDIYIYYIYIALYSYIHNINNYVHTHTDIYICISVCVHLFILWITKIDDLGCKPKRTSVRCKGKCRWFSNIGA